MKARYAPLGFDASPYEEALSLKRAAGNSQGGLDARIRELEAELARVRALASPPPRL